MALTIALLGAIFVAVFFLVVGTHRFIIRRGLYLQEEAKSRLSPIASGQSQAVLVREEVAASQFAFLNRFLSGSDLAPKLATSLRQAGVNMTPGVFLLVMAVAALAGALLGSSLGPLGTVGGGAVGLWRRAGGCIGRSAGVSTSSTSNFRARSTCW